MELFVYCTALKITSRNQSLPSNWSFARADVANNADDQMIDSQSQRLVLKLSSRREGTIILLAIKF